ncbi:hypothetical protein N7379_01390 [Rhizobium pusense]|uniref:hypothetical protein n=1 Tax=Agrobacterium TaxID=357 RepID=UPI001AECC562|nr:MULTISPECIES: hypothetical protein [Agrobacterium]MDH0113118.1 hypothetical protein [Agrobacterium pusense]
MLDTMALRHELLDSNADKRELTPAFAACLNAHGMYETMRFVLRLSPLNHSLIEQFETDQSISVPVSSEAIQAYSTYIHETIHWWQHVGSTSGLLLSLSYLAQSHSSIEDLRKVLATNGPIKPLKAYTDRVLMQEGDAAQAKLASANTAVNNALDVEYYKHYALSPRENIRWMIEEKHFQCVGHGYFIVYGQLVGLLASTIDQEFSVLPDIDSWDAEIARLSEEKVEGYYWRSRVKLPAVGMRAVYEGQARFVQLQFLDGASSSERLTMSDWRERGYLSGVYVEAFDAFLKLSGAEWPERLDDPLVALFLLVCDLAINPTRGMPIEIENFEEFITDVDVGLRFTRICQAVRELPHLQTAITEFSREQYLSVADELTELTGYDHPMSALDAIRGWSGKLPDLAALMEEYRTFEYSPVNVPIRVFLSHFVAFCQDKFAHPEFFCWPGIYMSGQRHKPEARTLWLRHLSLFSDRGDRNGVYPRKWPDRSEKAVMETFNRFYGSMALYDLTRQWILEDGPFVCDFRWLAERYDQDRANKWGNDSFRQVYGVTLEDFQILGAEGG